MDSIHSNGSNLSDSFDPFQQVQSNAMDSILSNGSEYFFTRSSGQSYAYDTPRSSPVQKNFQIKSHSFFCFTLNWGKTVKSSNIFSFHHQSTRIRNAFSFPSSPRYKKSEASDWSRALTAGFWLVESFFAKDKIKFIIMITILTFLPASGIRLCLRSMCFSFLDSAASISAARVCKIYKFRISVLIEKN